MSQVRTNDHRAALVEFAKLDLLFAFGCLEKNQLRAAPGRMPSRFLKSEHVLIKRHRLLQVFHPVAGVQQFLDHRVSYFPLNGLNSNSSSTQTVMAAPAASSSLYFQPLL